MDTLVCLVLVLAVVPGIIPSAIPMWEFLSRGEKMSHLFNMFSKQVADHCDTSTMPDCNKVLMMYGLSNLAKMEDEKLDAMDPYQRGAMDIIWDHMMHGEHDRDHGHSASQSFDNEPVSSDNQLGAASSSVEQYASAGPAPAMMGPMVVRVYPDGRPVPDDVHRPPHRDEDQEEYLAMRAKPVPSMADLMRSTSRNVHSSTPRG
ncbi:rhythmically expressed gene 5 protein [Macrosteles quadrilineatus]|uniref:rhythmically expressed gene 5 protein n=1 Tax=Macrosteles quadrilineatus TaxID=74068 RepID=UPI0023E0DA00|nr:rhythmically expressed gene 5 protein [Macrosteles quadrilineatus]